MEIHTADIVYIVMVSIASGILAYFMGQYSKPDPKNSRYKNQTKMKKFFMTYPWIVSIIVLLLFGVFVLLE